MRFWLAGTLIASIATLSLATGLVVAQTPIASTKAATNVPNKRWTPPRTAWGAPDLQGKWTSTTSTPLERPKDLADKATLSEEELAARTRQIDQENADQPLRPGVFSFRQAYNNAWYERGPLISRTSLITDPPDGRLPPVIPEAQTRIDEVRARLNRGDSWEDRSPYERCLTRGLPGAMMGDFYGHNYQIVQSPSHVVILVEMIHDARIIPLDGRPRLGDAIRLWMGDSRGHWEGDTLVVETANFNGRVHDRSHLVFGSSDRARLTERFTRVDEHTIDYQFAVDDPATYTRPWTAAIPMRRTEARVYEYACHEGNYGLRNTLSAFRAEEKAAAAAEGRK